MAQPIRKNIQEAHPDLIKEPAEYTLIIDGGSLLFACFADTKVNSDGVHYGGVYQFLSQLRTQLSKKDYDYVYVFFDNEFSGWMRWNLYKQYKANRDKHYEDYAPSDYMKQCNANIRAMETYLFNKEKKSNNHYYRHITKDNYAVYYEVTQHLNNSITIDYVKRKIGQYESIRGKGVECSDDILKKSQVISKLEYKKFAKSDTEYFIDTNFARERDILCRYFNELFIRWYIDDVVEGDDLIAYYCKNKKPNEKIVIVTGDMDLSQLLADDICIYNLQLKKFITNKNYKDYYGFPCENIMVKKVFCGDTSDNISNINGLSESKFFEIMPEAKEKPITIEDVKARAKDLIKERIDNKKKPYKVHENIVNGVANKKYDGDFYEINKKIIDLSEPLLTDEAKEEMDTMMYAPMDPEDRSFGNLYKLINEDKIEDLMGETNFASFFNIFKRIETKEKKRFEENI